MLKEMKKAIKSMPTRSSAVMTYNPDGSVQSTSGGQGGTSTYQAKNPNFAQGGNTFRNLVKAPAKRMVTGARPIKKRVGQAPAMNWKSKGYKPSNGIGVGK